MLVKAGIGALLGGLLGAAVWVAIGFYTGYEVGLIAWGIGAAAGLGAVLFVGQSEAETSTGVVAAVIAVLTILGAKYAVAYAVVERDITQFLPGGGTYTVTDEDVIATIADKLIEDHVATGKEVEWPEFDEEVGPMYPDEYPKQFVEAADKQWKGMSAEEQRAKHAEVQRLTDESLAEYIRTVKPIARMEAFKGSFGLFDLLWIGLAIASAFKLGSGLGND